MSGVVHIAGTQVQVGNQLRQRCSWCGAVLQDYDLERTAGVIDRPNGTWSGPGMWEVGALVEVDGHVSSVVPHNDGDRLPPHACARCILPAGHDPTLGHMTVSGIADFAHYTWPVTAGEQVGRDEGGPMLRRDDP